jgi:hypothetical protein
VTAEPHSIAAANELPPEAKRRLYGSILPEPLLARFGINPVTFCDAAGRSLFTIRAAPGTPSAELDLRHAVDAPDPLAYLHVADTMNRQVTVLLFVINDPSAPRFDVDRLPDGTKTRFGTETRNIAAEVAAMQAGLAPGQVRRGLRILPQAAAAFEGFVRRLGHDLYLVEPLAYHIAVLLERYGFKYQQGRKRMEDIHAGFGPGGDLRQGLDGSTPFRQSGAERTIRGRSWAIHDGLLGEPFTGFRMYKQLVPGAAAPPGPTFPDALW